MVEKSNKVFYVRIISGMLSLVTIIWIVSLSRKEDSNMGMPVFIGIVILGIFLLSVFNKKIREKLKINNSNQNTIEVISNDKLTELIEKTVNEELWNYRMPGYLMVRIPFNIGNNIIYAIKIKLLYEEFFDNNYTDEIFIIINGTYPDKVPPAILPPKTGQEALKQAINYASLNPSNEPNVEITRTTLDQFNRPVEEKERRVYKNEENKPEEEEKKVI